MVLEYIDDSWGLQPQSRRQVGPQTGSLICTLCLPLQLQSSRIKSAVFANRIYFPTAKLKFMIKLIIIVIAMGLNAMPSNRGAHGADLSHV